MSTAAKALSMVMERSVVIVGGGIGGLATAAALRKVGGSFAGDRKVVVFEKSPDADGAAVQLGPNGLRALRYIGGEDFLEKVVKSGSVLKSHEVVGHTVVVPDTTMETTGLPQVLIRWGLLRSLLADLLPDNTIVPLKCTGYRTKHDCLEILGTGGEVVQDASLLIAADGIRSQFSEVEIRDNGRINIKAVVNKVLEKEGTTLSFFRDNVACFAGPAGEGCTYWAISVADVDGKSIFDRQDSREIVYNKLMDILKEVDCSFALELVTATDHERLYIARSEESAVVGRNLVHEDSRIVVVGDAGHAMSPAYGQAANFALEDAATLALCLRELPFQEALERYSSCRVGRCVEMQRKSIERTTKAMKGEQAEDITPWIFQWSPETVLAPCT